jgi:hypothetical protein
MSMKFCKETAVCLAYDIGVILGVTIGFVLLLGIFLIFL